MLKFDASKSPDVLLGDIHAYIAKVEQHIEARETVDLAGLDRAVEALCKQVLGLGKNESQKYSAQLGTLMEAIEAMQGKMMKMQSEVAKAIKALDTQKKAAKAYINAPKVEK
jgi:hypothetical protein